MNLIQNLDYLRGISLSKLPQAQAEAVKSQIDFAKEFDNDPDVLSQVPDLESDIQALVRKIQSMGIEKGASTSLKPATTKPTGSTAQKITLADKQAKARAAAKTPSGNSTNAQKILDKSNLQKSVQEKYELVKQNARFKNQIGEELTNYLKTNVVRLGLGGLPIDYEIEQLKAKDKFYTNLLKNDKDDFKAIAKRLGLTFKTVSNMATPAAYRKKDENGKPLPAQKAVKQKPDTRNTKQRESDAWNWLK